MKKLTVIALLITIVGFAAAQQTSGTFTGIITCTMSKDDHSKMKIQTESKSVIGCVRFHKGKYALYDGRNLYVLSDQQTPEKFAAQKVKVKGVLYEKTKILKVESIEAAK